MQTIRYYRGLGVRFERVLTDNGAFYRSHNFRRLVRRLGMRHLRTRPYTPRTNGKAERLGCKPVCASGSTRAHT